MTTSSIMRFAPACLALLVFASAPAQANDSVAFGNYELRSILGPGGRAYATSQDFTHNTGAYECRSTGSGTTVVTFPFVVPDAEILNRLIVTGQRTSAAPPLTLRLVESCMKWSEVVPTNTVLMVRVPSPNVDGFFTTVLFLGNGHAPNNYDCKYRVEARFDTSTVKCTSGVSRIQKISVWSTPADRIFRGSFHTNVTQGTP